MGFVHLNVRSSYTLLQSAIHLKDYVQYAKNIGFHTVAITDHQVLNGAYQLIQLCEANGLKPLIGMSVDLYVKDEKRPCRFILYAKNMQGYQSLVEITNDIHLNKGKMSLDDLLSYEHIIPIVSFYDTFVEELLYLGDGDLALNIFSILDEHFDNWYINIDPISSKHSYVHDWLLKQERSLLDKAIITCDVRYLKEKDRIGYESLIAMKSGMTYEQVHLENPSGTHLLSEQELVEKLEPVWMEAVERTSEIAKLCQINFPDQLFDLPHFPISNGMSADEYLSDLCFKQLKVRYREEELEIARKRLEYELEVIKNMRFSDYFLIVWDIVQYAKKNGILVGPGRGSAAGSIVAYLLGIIEVDPIKYNLLFERFLNPERQSMPDIDIDFSDYRRDEVIKYVAEKYGRNFSAQIITFGTFQARSTIRELSKIFQIEPEQLNYLLKYFSRQTDSIKNVIKENVELQTYVKRSKRMINLFKAALVIEGLPRHYSTHAAGVVISDESLLKKIPVIDGQDGLLLTQWPMKDLESIGLLKMDFLGLRNLSFLEFIVKQIKEKENVAIDLLKIPLDDPKTFQLLQKGFTSGVFQLESEGMKKALKAIKPTEIDDIIAVNALFRPGPMQFIETFAKRKHRLEQTTYVHDDLKEILKPTYGVLVYQEQIMQVANKIANFSYGEADLLRRAISKKDSSAFVQLKEQFIQGSINNGYERSIAEKIFEWIEKFANYGFNKSHAASYSLISYQTAYFKANYPAYFYAELMSHHMHDHDKLLSYIKEAKSLGIKILPPSINKSFGKFTVESKQAIRFGLLAIKGVGKQAYDEIINARGNEPFKHLFDFCKRIPLNAVNQSIIETLILAGAFDETKRHRAELLASVMPAIEQGELFSGLEDQISLNGDFGIEVSYQTVEPFSAVKQLRLEKEVLGFIISEHPLIKVRRALQRRNVSTIDEVLKETRTQNKTIVCLVDKIKQVRTKRGEQMAFILTQDETGEIDAVIFPKVHRECSRWLEEEIFVTIIGRKDERNGKVQIIVDSIKPFNIDDLPKTTDARLIIKLNEKNENEQLNILKKISSSHEGATPIIVYSPNQKKSYQLKAEYDVTVNDELLKKLEEIFGTNSVVYKN